MMSIWDCNGLPAVQPGSQSGEAHLCQFTFTGWR
jgi:hypothetical protein